MEVLVPIMVCVVLPIVIIGIVYGAGMYRNYKRTQVLIKAMETGNGVDVAGLVEAMEEKSKRTPRDVFYRRVLRGCICGLIGLVFIAAGVISWCAGGTLEQDNVSGMLLSGGVLLAVGLSYLIVCLMTRKDVSKN